MEFYDFLNVYSGNVSKIDVIPTVKSGLPMKHFKFY